MARKFKVFLPVRIRSTRRTTYVSFAQGEDLVEKILDVKTTLHKTKPNEDKVLCFLIASNGLSPFQLVYGSKPDIYVGLVLETQRGLAYDKPKDRADIQKLVTTNLVEAKLFQ